MSLLHEFRGNRYVVNLVDTPGHVDFSGKVTRAMRAIDGAIVVVDAVEGVMAQTESVIRSAVKERVKPVLFINKIDRLIKELKLSAGQTQEKFSKIIHDVNQLITTAAGSKATIDWNVSTESNSVAFGSALDRWAFTVPQMQQLNLRFQDIIEHYQRADIQTLSEILPIHKPILMMILESLPSPSQAQSYRTQHIWKGQLDSPAGAALQECNPEGPLIFEVTKILSEPKLGVIAIGRIFSGTMKKGTQVRILPVGTLQRIQRISLFMGSRQVIIPQLTAGNICGLIGLEDVQAGDTITGQTPLLGMVPFEQITYINEPVVTIAIEPKHARELPRLLRLLEMITRSDPNLTFLVNEQTGENLLSGLGLLHLEITLKDIQKLGVEILSSDPIVLYRETPITTLKGQSHTLSPNGKNSILISVQPTHHEPLTESVWYTDNHGNKLVDSTNIQIPESVKHSIIEGAGWALERGPLCSEPVGLTTIRIDELELSENIADQGPVELMAMVKDAIFEAFDKTGMTLLEPIYEIQAIVSSEYLKDVSQVIISKRGQIEHVDYKGTFVTINGLLPVSESFDLANVLRSKTSGKANWQTKFASWQVLPGSHLQSVIENIRRRRGLI
ncbi:MAG: GTP-binding protein [Candidatus Hermodarchaeota archaeon]|nr:GTP-binding protein [Candidatus Hermodarchaeota archaeon]